MQCNNWFSVAFFLHSQSAHSACVSQLPQSDEVPEPWLKV